MVQSDTILPPNNSTMVATRHDKVKGRAAPELELPTEPRHVEPRFDNNDRAEETLDVDEDDDTQEIRYRSRNQYVSEDSDCEPTATGQ